MNCGYPFFYKQPHKIGFEDSPIQPLAPFCGEKPKPMNHGRRETLREALRWSCQAADPSMGIEKNQSKQTTWINGVQSIDEFFCVFFSPLLLESNHPYFNSKYIYIHAFPEWYHAFPWISWLLTFSSVWGLLNSYPHDLTVGSICWVMYCWSPLWIWIGSPCYANSPTNSAVNAGNSLSVSWLLRWTSGIAALWKLGWSATSNPRFWGSNAPTHKSLS